MPLPPEEEGVQSSVRPKSEAADRDSASLAALRVRTPNSQAEPDNDETRTDTGPSVRSSHGSRRAQKHRQAKTKAKDAT